VTAPRRGHVKDAIHLHHSTILEEEDLDVCNAVPVTSVARTLLDQASTQARKRVESLIERAERCGLLEVDSINAILARSGRHRGRKNLRSAVDIYREPVMSRARSERLLLAIVKRAGLPRPAINSFVAGHEIDAYWERERFAVEIDGYETHGTRAAFERDPIRIEDLKLQGIDAIRITARRVEREPDQVVERLRALLRGRRRALGLV
jgi:very-short-patch-repair endonuclease